MTVRCMVTVSLTCSTVIIILKSCEYGDNWTFATAAWAKKTQNLFHPFNHWHSIIFAPSFSNRHSCSPHSVLSRSRLPSSDCGSSALQERRMVLWLVLILSTLIWTADPCSAMVSSIFVEIISWINVTYPGLFPTAGDGLGEPLNVSKIYIYITSKNATTDTPSILRSSYLRSALRPSLRTVAS